MSVITKKVNGLHLLLSIKVGNSQIFGIFQKNKFQLLFSVYKKHMRNIITLKKLKKWPKYNQTLTEINLI